MKTEDKIVAKALEMFNIMGIEYVGLREISAELGIRVGNITYYFPTKDDLVNRLSLDLNILNSKVFVADPNMTLEGFIEMIDAVFQNHLKYRCLLLSFVHLVARNKPMSIRYKNMQNERYSTFNTIITSLVQSGQLKIENENEIKFLVSTLALVIRFWISESQVSFPDKSTEYHVNHYLSLIIHQLLPYASPNGKAELLQLLVRYE